MMGIDPGEMSRIVDMGIPELGKMLGMDPAKISNLLNDPNMLMMGGMMLMNPMMMCLDPPTTMNMFGADPMKLMGMDQSMMNSMMGMGGMMGMGQDPRQMGKMGGGMGCMMEAPAAIADKPRSKNESRGLPPALRNPD